MDKGVIVEFLISELRRQYERAIGALQDAAEGATGDDTAAESKYDTRALESSYLAAGQSAQADRLASELAKVEGASFPAFRDDSCIDSGALVSADMDGETVHYLLAPGGGGTVIEAVGALMVTVIAPNSPLYQNLLGMTKGERLDRPAMVIKGIA